MEESKSQFKISHFFGYAFILLLIVLSFTGTADKIAVTLINETQQSTAIYALLLKSIAGALTFIPDNDSLAPFIDTFDRAGTLLFIASITITLQKIMLTLFQMPLFSIILAVMLVATIANKLSGIFDKSFTILVRKYLIILLILRFFITASAVFVYGGVGVLIDTNDENNAKRAELVDLNIQEIIASKSKVENQNEILQKSIEKFENQIIKNKKMMEEIGIKWIGKEDAKVVELREQNKNLEIQIKELKNKKISSWALFSQAKIAIENIKVWFKDIFEGIFTTVSIFLLKIVIFPFITYMFAFKLGRVVIGNDTLTLMKNAFKLDAKK